VANNFKTKGDPKSLRRKSGTSTSGKDRPYPISKKDSKEAETG